MRRRTRLWLRVGAAMSIALVLAFGCKRAEEEADTCEDEDAPAATAAAAPDESAPAALGQRTAEPGEPSPNETPKP